jgi:hypothetical protein
MPLNNYPTNFNVYIVMNMAIDRQRFGKDFSKVRQSTVEGRPLLGSKSLGTYPPLRAVATKLAHIS